MAKRGSKLLKILLLACSLLVFGAAVLAWTNASEAAKRNRPYDAKTLSAQELAEVREVFAMQREFGSMVFHGFGPALVPLVLYNDRYEFLSGYATMKASAGDRQTWEKVATGRDVYFRRMAKGTESFARKIDGQSELDRPWVGSIQALDPMNRDRLIMAREQLPEPAASLFPYPWLTTDPDMHVVLALHEMFHAYQAQQNETRFNKAAELFAIEKVYPYRKAGFEQSWDREGELLHAGLQAGEDSDRRACIRAFLEHRRQRRLDFGLGEEQIAFECEMEWLEGLGRYVEMRFHELAADQQRRFGEQGYPSDLPHWWDEMRRLGASLGSRDGQFRFYLSGMAQARILDRQLPGWQERAIRNARLEDLLAETIAR